MSVDIKGKIALVTGANRGIGKAIVESFIEHGAAKVYLAVRNLESTNELTATYAEKVVPVKVDMADAESIKQLASVATDVDVVVNNAGVLEKADILSTNIEQALDYEMTVNVLGLIRIAQVFVPILEQKSNSAFVQLNSVASIKNFGDFTSYSASKAAAFTFTQGLRERLLGSNIAVLSVHPGPIATDMVAQTGVKEIAEIAEPTSVVSEAIVDALKTGQFLLFPDTMAKQFEQGFSSYAENFILPVPE